MRDIPVWTVRRCVIGALLASLPWLIAPGLTQPDTKTDLTISLWAYLLRSLTAWNDHAALGELQNQSYGYLFPMGPVVGLADVALPAWAAQRVWWSLLFVLAWWGTDRLIRRLDIAGPTAAAVAGVSYALAPRVLTVLAEISVEAWPAALAPWLVLAALPLTDPELGRRRRWHAAASTGLLVAALGGVNAVASAVVLLLPATLLLVGRARRACMVAWLVGVALGALWWIAPLLVLGRYAYPFLDFIETSGITTATTGVTNSLRGASHWIAYILDREDHPVWQGGWVEAQDPIAIVATACVAGAGLAGIVLLHSDARHARLARWMTVAAVAATALMAVGHAGALGSPVAEPVRALLDGPLAPLRNVHKLDPVIRLPIALGVAHLLSRLRAYASRPQLQTVGVAAVCAALVLSPMAVWTGRVADPHGYPDVPSTWRAVADDIDRDAAQSGGATLLLPASRNAHYDWGSATDEPLSALAASPVAVRASAPLGHPGATRLLDRIDLLAASGESQPELGSVLIRMGITRVVVRHDLRSSAGALPAASVERTLAKSPGFERLQRRGALSVWSVKERGNTADRVAVYPNEGVAVAGSPEALTDAVATGLLRRGEAASIAPGLDSADVVSDSGPWRVFHSGRPAHEAYGPWLGPRDHAPTVPGARNLPPILGSATAPTLRLMGLDRIEASSSAADPFAAGYVGPGAAPFAAFDDRPDSAWIAEPAEEGVAEIRWKTTKPVAAGPIRIKVADGADLVTPTHVEVTFGRGAAAVTQRVPVRDGAARVKADREWSLAAVRLVGLTGAQQGGIAGIHWPGQQVGAWLQVPGSVDLTRQALLVHRDSAAPDTQAARPADGDALLRGFDSRRRTSVSPEVTVRARPGAELNRLLDRQRSVSGPRIDDSPEHRPGAALDGRADTRWVVPAGEQSPTLRITFDSPQQVAGLRLSSGRGVREVRVRATPTTPVRTLSATGGAINVRTRTLDVQVVRHEAGQWNAPEITIKGMRPSPPATALSCGEAGSVSTNTGRTPLAATPSEDDLLRGNPIRARACSTLQIPRGQTRLTASSGGAVEVETVVLRSDATSMVSPARTVSGADDATGKRTVTLDRGPASVLALTEGRNDGWVARTAEGTALRPVTVDGWRQGFAVPASDATTVSIRFEPTLSHRLGLLGGFLAVVLLAAIWFGCRAPTAHSGQWRCGATIRRRAPVRAVLTSAPVAALVGGLVAGPVGAVAGFGAALVPRRLLPVLAIGGVAASGVVLAIAGTADQQAMGAALSQVAGVLSLGALVGAWRCGYGAGSAAPATAPTPTRSPG